MKTIFALSMFISLAMICSCHKQDSAAEAQLAERKTQLDQREKALDERERALERRETAVAERENAVAGGRIIQSQRQPADAAQAEAERQRRIQQLPPELRALIPDRSRLDAMKAQKEAGMQDRALQRESSIENARQKKMSAMAAPQADARDQGVTSPSPSPTP